MEFDPTSLLKLARMRMPFGKYKGLLLVDLPEDYVLWFYNQGLPEGELGELMAQLYEIKVNGLEYLFEPLKLKK
jgi:uncharacterized protein (DUF3820 family)